MLARTSALSVLVLALPLLVAANAVPRTEPVNQCNTGSIQCCNSVKKASDPGLTTLLSLLKIVGPITGPVGIKCSPISVIGGGNSCSQQPVCCTNNSFNGVIAMGCTPININV